MTFRKFKKLINKYFIVEDEPRKSKSVYKVDFAYVKFDEPHFLYSVRLEIVYRRKPKTISICSNNLTAHNPHIYNSRDKFENIVFDIYKQVGNEKNYWIKDFREELNNVSSKR